MTDLKVSLLKVALNKKRIIFVIVIICVLCFPLTYSTISGLRLKGYEKKTLPHTDKALRFLMNNEYDQLYQHYASDSGMNLYDFKQQVEKLHTVFGRIHAYRYKGFSSSDSGIFGRLLGFYMTYDIEFDSKKTHQGNFSIEIDKDTHMPKIGRILTFNISSDFGKKIFYLRLVRKKGVGQKKGEKPENKGITH